VIQIANRKVVQFDPGRYLIPAVFMQDIDKFIGNTYNLSFIDSHSSYMFGQIPDNSLAIRVYLTPEDTSLPFSQLRDKVDIFFFGGWRL
jgi:hypothetical protein